MRLLDKYALDNAKIVIVGNKQDLRQPTDVDNELELTKEDGMEAAFCYQGKFMEVSVLTTKNVEKTIKRLVTLICHDDDNDNETQQRKPRKVTFSPP